MVTSSNMDRARVMQSRTRVVDRGSRGIGSRWGRCWLIDWLRSRFVCRSRRMIRSRMVIRVNSCSFIGNLCHIPSMVVSMVVHYLGTTIRQGHGVRSFHYSSLILCLSFSKLSSRILVSYPILILVRTSRFLICRSMVDGGRGVGDRGGIRCRGRVDRGIGSRGMVERGMMNWGVVDWGMMKW